MTRAYETDLDQLKRETRILDVLERYGVFAEKKGKGYFARCPFHEDTNASLSIDATRNIWNCFSCGKGGSVIDFVMFKENIGIRDAVGKLLVETSNGHICRGSSFAKATEDKSSLLEPQAPAEAVAPCPDKSEIINRHSEIVKGVVEYYQKTLAGPDDKGLQYLRHRCLGDPETLKHFAVGYANGTLKKVLPADAIEPLKKIGILNEKGNEFFYGCIVVPIYCADGSFGSMYGRSVEGSRHLYMAGNHRGVINARSTEVYDEIILTEAILDALSLYSVGVKNVIPCYGTNGFTADHAAILAKMKRVHLAFDNDKAGDDGAKKLAERLAADGKECHRVNIPSLDAGIKDLNDYVKILRGQGLSALEIKSAFDELLKHAPRVGHHWEKRAACLQLAEQTDTALIFQNCEAFYHLRGLFDNSGTSLRVILTASREDIAHTDRLDLYTAKHRVSFAYRAGARLDMPAAKIEEDLSKLIPMLETLLAEGKSKSEETAKVPEMLESEKRDALALLRAPDLLARTAADLETVGYVGEDRNKQLVYLIATSRKLDKPLSAIIRSESGAGKSYLMECVAELMPPEDVKYFSRLTPQSLYYMEKNELVHKLLIVDERDGSEESEYPIRTLQTRRKLTLAVPIKDPSSGKIQTKQIEILGPIAYMESTTAATINPENANRSFEIYLDESDEQTRKIYASQKKAHTLEGWKDKRRKEETLRIHHNAQRLLRPVKVLIPFIHRIKFPVSWTRGRRDHDRLLCLIESIAFLYQHQRPQVTTTEGDLSSEALAKEGYIEATSDDYAKAYDLARSAFTHALTDMPREAKRLLSHIRAMVKEWAERLGLDEKDYGFRRRDVREYAKQPDHLVKRAMRMLEELEYLHVRRSGRGGSFVYTLGRHPTEKDPLDGLTTPEELRKSMPGVAIQAKTGGPVHCLVPHSHGDGGSQERSDGESGTKVEQGPVPLFSEVKQ